MYCAHKRNGKIKWCYIGRIERLPNFSKRVWRSAGGGIRTHAALRQRILSPSVFQVLSRYVGMVNIEDFYNFLKFRRIGEETIKDYLSVFKKIKSGKLESSSKYTIITCRLLIHFLYYVYNIDLKEYLDLLKVPKSGIDLFVPSEDQVKNTLRRAKRREDILTAYTVLLASGIRLSEAILFLRTYRRSKLIRVDDMVVKYPISSLRQTKRIFYAYLP